MPLTLNVGVSKKIGQPDYGSLGASCHVEVELDAGLLCGDSELLQQRVRQAYAACGQAVNDELARHQHGPTQVNSTPGSRSNGHAGNTNGANANGGSSNGRPARRDGPRPATVSQVRALNAIAERQQFDLAKFLADRFQVQTADQLSIREASDLIDELKSGTGRNGVAA